MKLYFSKSQVPELAGLAPLRRKLVYQCALEALLTEQPSTIWICSFWLLGSILIGALAGGLTDTGCHFSHPILIVTVGGLVGALIGVFIGTQFLTARLRPYLRRVLEERKDEIARIS
jgi:membrane protein DedA with SNARE-associated domain